MHIFDRTPRITGDITYATFVRDGSTVGKWNLTTLSQEARDLISEQVNRISSQRMPYVIAKKDLVSLFPQYQRPARTGRWGGKKK